MMAEPEVPRRGNTYFGTSYLLIALVVFGWLIYRAATTDNRPAAEHAWQTARPANVRSLVLAVADSRAANQVTTVQDSARTAGWLLALHQLAPTRVSDKQFGRAPQLGEIVLTFTPAFAAKQRLRQPAFRFAVARYRAGFILEKADSETVYRADSVDTLLRQVLVAP